MRLICLLLVVVGFSGSCVAGDVSLYLGKDNDLILVSVVNTSQGKVKVSRLFTENPGYGLIEFFVYVNGVRFGSLIPPNENLPVASNYIELSPLGTVGKAFYVSDIRKRYRVPEGCFHLTVEYHDIMARKFDAYSGTLKSNDIYVCDKETLGRVDFDHDM